MDADRKTRLFAALVDGCTFTALYLLAHVPLVGAVGFLGMLALVVGQVFLLTTRGQTLGKLWFGLKIVRADTGANGGFVTNVLLRSCLNGIFWVFPPYFIADNLFIFRQDRRCLRDLLAKTRVVRS